MYMREMTKQQMKIRIIAVILNKHVSKEVGKDFYELLVECKIIPLWKNTEIPQELKNSAIV